MCKELSFKSETCRAFRLVCLTTAASETGPGAMGIRRVSQGQGSDSEEGISTEECASIPSL